MNTRKLYTKSADGGHDTIGLVRKAAERVEKLASENEDLIRGNKELSARMREVEQKMARGWLARLNGVEGGEQSLGQQFVESDEFKTLALNERGRASFTTKATLTLGSTSGGAAARPDRLATPVELGRRSIRIRDVLSQGQTASNSVEFVRQNLRTNTAAPVAETNTKPEAALGYELVTAPVRTIAVTLPASRQVLADAPMLQSMIDAELLYMLADQEEKQLLAGDGTGANVLGLIPQATAFAASFTLPTPTWIDVLLLAAAQNEAADFESTFIAVNPLDWRRIQAFKDDQKRYLGNGPFSAEQVARLWNLPVVPTKGITVNKFLVGDGQRGAQVFDRWQARVEVSTEHADFFVRNMVMMLAEERLALAVYKPNAFIYGDFTTALVAATA